MLGCLEDCEENLIDWIEMKANRRAVEGVAGKFPPSDEDSPAYH
ncbi:MAG: hypothetical protein WB217_09730 [Mesobacillus sp.]